MTDREIFEICVGIAKIWTDIHKLICSKIEEGDIESWLEAPKSVYILAIPTQISNISPSVTSLISIIVEYYSYAGSADKLVMSSNL